MSLVFNKLLRSGKPTFGAWISIPDPSVVEVMSQCSYDFLLFDGEHGPISTQDLRFLLPVTQALNAPVIYRPGSHWAADIKAALDVGVDALLVPMVESAEQARALVNAAKYPPLGQRGIGPWRASNYYQDFDTYLQTANSGTSLVLQIESPAGVEAAPMIAAVDGVDALYIGPADLASNFGLPVGELSADMLALCKQVADAAKTAGKPIGIDLASPKNIAALRELGFSFFTHGQDILLMMEAARATVNQLRCEK